MFKEVSPHQNLGRRHSYLEVTEEIKRHSSGPLAWKEFRFKSTPAEAGP